jgi:hypothetical protein
VQRYVNLVNRVNSFVKYPVYGNYVKKYPKYALVGQALYLLRNDPARFVTRTLTRLRGSRNA